MIFAATTMRLTKTSLLAICAASILPTGCAGSGDKYPSLAIRDVERAQGQFAPVAGIDAEPIRPVASAQDIAALVEMAKASHTKFIQAEAGTRDLIGMARGDSIDSNARQKALVALADLSTLRSDTALPMGDLDLLKAEAATTFAPTAAIDEARRRVLEILATQDSTLDALWSDLGQ